MRPQIPKKHSTKTERIFIEALKECHVEFLFRTKVGNREVDFIVGNYAIEINGHEQNTQKNEILVGLGYTPLHVSNSGMTKDNAIKLIKQII